MPSDRDYRDEANGVTLLHGDCRELMRALPENSVDSIVCDPPYLLGFMGKEFDQQGGSHRSPKQMQEWHYSWATEAIRVLKPGGHLLAFSGTRTVHRLACAIEDAGFEIRDNILNMLAADEAFCGLWDTLSDEQRSALAKSFEAVGLNGWLTWNHGQGFPKGLDISCAIDKAAGEERDVVGQRVYANGAKGRWWGNSPSDKFAQDAWTQDDSDRQKLETVPTTDAAKQWAGWNVALKPAFEPIVVARKPLSESSVSANVLKWGCGGLNIGACRIGIESADNIHAKNPHTNGTIGANGIYGAGTPTTYEVPTGRWPANVLLQHVSADANGEGGCRCVGTRKVSGTSRGGLNPVLTIKGYNGGALGQRSNADHGYTDTKKVSHADADGNEEVAAWECVPGCPCTMFPESTSGAQIAASSGSATRFFYQAKASKVERYFYCRDCQQAYCETEREKHGHGHLNADGKQDWKHVVAHPTVKPIGIISYLLTLATRPGGVVLDCFLGTGTAAVAAIQKGFDLIGMEQDGEYMEIAKARCRDEVDQFPLFSGLRK